MGGRMYGALALGMVIALSGCAGFGDGVIDITGDGKGVNRVTAELLALKSLRAGADGYAKLKPCQSGQDFLHDFCGDPSKQEIAAKAVPHLDTAINALSPLVDSEDKAAIDKAFDLANKARGML